MRCVTEKSEAFYRVLFPLILNNYLQAVKTRRAPSILEGSRTSHLEQPGDAYMNMYFLSILKTVVFSTQVGF